MNIPGRIIRCGFMLCAALLIPSLVHAAADSCATCSDCAIPGNPTPWELADELCPKPDLPPCTTPIDATREARCNEEFRRRRGICDVMQCLKLDMLCTECAHRQYMICRGCDSTKPALGPTPIAPRSPDDWQEF